MTSYYTTRDGYLVYLKGCYYIVFLSLFRKEEGVQGLVLRKLQNFNNFLQIMLKGSHKKLNVILINFNAKKIRIIALMGIHENESVFVKTL